MKKFFSYFVPKEQKIEVIKMLLGEKEISPIEAIIMMGGLLGGSRGLGIEEKESDWDFFFKNSKNFDDAVKILEETGAVFGFREEIYQKVLIHPGRYMGGGEVVGYEKRMKFFHTPGKTIINKLKIHLIKVDKILSREEALKLHFKYHPEKIKDEIKKIKAWQAFILKNKFVDYLSHEQKKEYEFWLMKPKFFTFFKNIF